MIANTMKLSKNLKLTSILAILAGFLFYAYEYILRISPSIMVSGFSSSMHISSTTLAAASSYYYFAYTPMQLAVGLLLDRYELKTVLTIAALACTFGTILILMADHPFVFSVGRFIQGCGSAFAWIGIIKMAAIYMPKKYYGLTTSFGAVFGFIGAAFGQALLGSMVNSYGDTITLTLLILMGFFITYFIFNELSRTEQQNPYTQGIKDKAPIPAKKVAKQFYIVLRTPYIWIAGIIAALLFTPTTVFAELWGVNYLAKLYSYSVAQSSFISSMIFIGFAIGAAISGVLTVFISSKIKLIRYGSFGAFLLVICLLYIKMPFEVLCFVSILFGMFSSVQVLSFTMGRDVLPARLAGITGSIINLICMGVGVGFQRLAGSLIALYWTGEMSTTGIRIYSITAYRVSMLILPIVLLSCYLFTFLIDEKRKKLKFNSKKLRLLAALPGILKLVKVSPIKIWALRAFVWKTQKATVTGENEP